MNFFGRPCEAVNSNLFCLTSERVLLARYLKIYSYQLDRAQRLFKHGVELRQKNPWFFSDRDPSSPEMRTVVETL